MREWASEPKVGNYLAIPGFTQLNDAESGWMTQIMLTTCDGPTFSKQQALAESVQKGFVMKLQGRKCELPTAKPAFKAARAMLIYQTPTVAQCAKKAYKVIQDMRLADAVMAGAKPGSAVDMSGATFGAELKSENLYRCTVIPTQKFVCGKSEVDAKTNYYTLVPNMDVFGMPKQVTDELMGYFDK